MAFDVADVDSGEEAPEFAKPGTVVTCRSCRAIIVACEKYGKQFRVPL